MTDHCFAIVLDENHRTLQTPLGLVVFVFVSQQSSLGKSEKFFADSAEIGVKLSISFGCFSSASVVLDKPRA